MMKTPIENIPGDDEPFYLPENQKDFNFDTASGINPNQNVDALTNKEFNSEQNLEYWESETIDGENRSQKTEEHSYDYYESSDRKDSTTDVRGDSPDSPGSGMSMGNP